MNLVNAAAWTIVVVLITGCHDAASVTPSPPSRTPSPRAGCTTSAAQGRCGPYDSYSRISATTSSTYVGNNVWNPVSRWRQTLSVTDPGSWQVRANIPAGSTAVASYPSIGANYGQTTNVPTPLSHYSAIHSTFSESMNATADTTAWAAYDIWLGRDGCSHCPWREVMIQHDFANNSACDSVATAVFGGAAGAPGQRWHLCQYGSELIWKLGPDEVNKISEQSGSVDILGMLTWLVDHRYLPPRTGLWSINYGWEICSTGGKDEDFRIRDFSTALTPTR